MKKIVIPLLLLVIGNTVTAQSEKKQPPPPPPHPKKVDEVVKVAPPKKAEILDTAIPPVVKVKGEMAEDFFNRNPSVSDISRQGNIITLEKKDGSTEKYGASPIPPPPPPPKRKSKA